MKTFLGTCLSLLVANAVAGQLGEPVFFTGTCDASAAITLSGDWFVVANDEDNLLRFYKFSRPGAPLQTFDLNPILGNGRKIPEADLEAATRLGDTVFFITSHGQKASGKDAPARHRLFALTLREVNGTTTVEPVGRTYTELVADLAKDARYARFHLAQASDLAPKETGALNIEALVTTPDGTLLIGFRNPIPGGRALLAPLQNPREVIRAAAPNFGEPTLLDLGGLGLRDMCAATRGYYLIAGPAEGGSGKSKLFTWDGKTETPALVREVNFPKINPEGICAMNFGDAAGYLIVSDDGAEKIGGVECKTLPESERRFRAYRYEP